MLGDKEASFYLQKLNILPSSLSLRYTTWGVHGNSTAFCALIVQADLGKPD